MCFPVIGGDQGEADNHLQWVCARLVLGDELLNLRLVFFNPIFIGGQ